MSAYAGPEIVNSGLVLALDAGNTKSYPGTGTTWTNLSSSVNNGNLTDAPTFDGVNAFTFNGTTNYIDCGTNSSLNLTSALSIEAWINPTSYGEGLFGRILDRAGSGTGYVFFMDGDGATGPGVRYGTNTPTVGVNVDSARNMITLSTWQQVVVTQSGSTVRFYRNGSLFFTSALAFPTPTGGVANAYVGNRLAQDRSFDGKISSVKVYNFNLTDTQIQQNFNAYRGRFGI